MLTCDAFNFGIARLSRLHAERGPKDLKVHCERVPRILLRGASTRLDADHAQARRSGGQAQRGIVGSHHEVLLYLVAPQQGGGKVEGIQRAKFRRKRRGGPRQHTLRECSDFQRVDHRVVSRQKRSRT